jgi:hypothetical protein
MSNTPNPVEVLTVEDVRCGWLSTVKECRRIESGVADEEDGQNCERLTCEVLLGF